MRAFQSRVGNIQGYAQRELMLNCEVPLLGLTIRLVGIQRLSVSAKQHLLVARIAMGSSLQAARIRIVQSVRRSLLIVRRVYHEVVQEVNSGL